MTRRFALLLAIATGALAVVSFALASAAKETYPVKAKLTAAKEVPKPKGTKPAAGGNLTGKYVENGSKVTLTWKLTFHSLTGKATAAHIHKGKAGKAGPVIVPLCGPCTSGAHKSVKISKDVVDAIEHGKAYVNVHTTKNAAGEIRGQISVAHK
jgi:hypothetical protein